MDTKEKYLPIGSVVLMKDAKKRVMVTGYAVKSPESGDKIWDYIGCLYPEGMVTANKNLLFQHESIDKVYALGYSDDEQKQFMEVLKKATKFHEEKAKETVTESESSPIE